MATVSAPSASTHGTDTTDFTYLREKKPKPYNPWWIASSILATIVISVAIYVIPSWHFLEVWTRDIVVAVLQLLGFDAYPTPQPFPWTPEWGAFGEASPNTPGVSIANVLDRYNAFWIVKACTGLQAGAILIALIIVTPLPSLSLKPNEDPQKVSALRRFKAEHQFLAKTIHKSLVIFLFATVLFITNALRIAFHLWLVALGYSFEFAHDDLSKPIGFFGTLFFAWVIEKSGIPIIDTFADWIDAIYLGLKGLISKVL